MMNVIKSGNSSDITDNFTLEPGQTSTYYGISKIKLKPGKPVPTGPIKISYNYYHHLLFLLIFYKILLLFYFL